MDESAGISMAIQAKISWERGAQWGCTLPGFRHYRNTLKDQPIKATNARFYLTDCVDARHYFQILKEMTADVMVMGE